MSTFFHSTTAVKSKRIKKLTWGKKGHLGGKAYLGEEHDNIIGIGKREETTVSDVVVADPVTANTQIQIHRYVNKNTQIQIHKYANTCFTWAF